MVGTLWLGLTLTRRQLWLEDCRHGVMRHVGMSDTTQVKGRVPDPKLVTRGVCDLQELHWEQLLWLFQVEVYNFRINTDWFGLAGQPACRAQWYARLRTLSIWIFSLSDHAKSCASCIVLLHLLMILMCSKARVGFSNWHCQGRTSKSGARKQGGAERKAGQGPRGERSPDTCMLDA